MWPTGRPIRIHREVTSKGLSRTPRTRLQTYRLGPEIKRSNIWNSISRVSTQYMILEGELFVPIAHRSVTLEFRPVTVDIDMKGSFWKQRIALTEVSQPLGLWTFRVLVCSSSSRSWCWDRNLACKNTKKRAELVPGFPSHDRVLIISCAHVRSRLRSSITFSSNFNKQLVLHSLLITAPCSWYVLIIFLDTDLGKHSTNGCRRIVGCKCQRVIYNIAQNTYSKNRSSDQ